MKTGQDISSTFPGMVIIHQKLRASRAELHVHEGHEIFIPLSGEIRIQLHDDRRPSPSEKIQRLEAGPGKMIYLPPGQKHAFESSPHESGERLILLIDPKRWKKTGGGVHAATRCTTSRLIQELVFHLLIHPKTKAASALLDTCIQTLSEILDESEGQELESGVTHLASRCSDQRIRISLELMSEHPEQPLKMSALARKAGMSLRNWNRLFLLECGRTPKQIQTLIRIQLAQSLLRKPKATVTDTAFEVGYQSVSQFISNYRRITGRLPSDDLH